MVVPAAIYLVLQHGRPGQAGWGIPMATDIAFVVGLLTLFGPRIPHGLKVLLLSLAIVDDMGAVLVIALFYTTSISYTALGMALSGFAFLALFRLLGVRHVFAYALIGLGIWLAVLKSGIHPTIAGVLLGLATPAAAWLDIRTLEAAAANVLQCLRATPPEAARQDCGPAVGRLSLAALESVSPLERLERALHSWVAFVVMPLFALANAGVALEPSLLADPVALAVAAGLVIGKPLGIVIFSWIAVRARLVRLPEGVDWKIMLGAGCLAGIGFTMSLFIAGLSLSDDLLAAGKAGTLAGSTASVAIGAALLAAALRRSPRVSGGGA
jgi:NhaA family Na+:H+ antiporter